MTPEQLALIERYNKKHEPEISIGDSVMTSHGKSKGFVDMVSHHGEFISFKSKDVPMAAMWWKENILRIPTVDEVMEKLKSNRKVTIGDLYRSLVLWWGDDKNLLVCLLQLLETVEGEGK